jgi:hypothetical protein
MPTSNTGGARGRQAASAVASLSFTTTWSRGRRSTRARRTPRRLVGRRGWRARRMGARRTARGRRAAQRAGRKRAPLPAPGGRTDSPSPGENRGEHFSGRAEKIFCYFGPKKSCPRPSHWTRRALIFGPGSKCSGIGENARMDKICL